MAENTKKWWKYLLWIPGILVIDLLLLTGAALLDVSLLPETATGRGHAFPAVSMLVSFALMGITALVMLWAVLKALWCFVKK